MLCFVLTAGAEHEMQIKNCFYVYFSKRKKIRMRISGVEILGESQQQVSHYGLSTAKKISSRGKQTQGVEKNGQLGHKRSLAR